MHPQTASIILALILVIYTIIPFDLLPDVLGLIGRIDELVLAGFLIWKYNQIRRRYQSRQSPQRDQDKTAESGPTGAEPTEIDPYTVFGLEQSAASDEIDRRYRELITQYHPDKVMHLGEEFRRMAHEKTIEIQAAYRKLRPDRH